MRFTSSYTPGAYRSVSRTGRSLHPAAPHFAIHRLEDMEGAWERGQRNKKGQAPFEMLWMTRGAGQLCVDQQVYELSPVVVYFLCPGQLQALTSDTPLEGYYLSFSPDFYYGALPETPSSSWEGPHDYWTETIMPLDEDIEQPVREILGQLYQGGMHYDSQTAELVKSLFRALVLYLSRKQRAKDCPGTLTRDTDLVRQFMHLLRKNVQHKKRVSDYARDLYVTPGYLNQVIKKVSGYTASHHIQQYIILQAKRQALHGKASMKEVAYDLGFSDVSHFSKFFKNNSGANFTHFLKGIC